MKNIRVFIIALLMTSCSVSMNVIPTINTPSFEEKNDWEVEMGITTNSVYENVNYALSDHWAITQSGFITYNSFSPRKYDPYEQPKLFDIDLNESPYASYKELYSDVSLGYYLRSNSLFQFVSVGYGLGDVRYQYKYSRDGGHDYQSSGLLQRVFGQYNVSYCWDNFDIGFALQAAYANLPLHSVVYNNFAQKTVADQRTRYHYVELKPFLYCEYGKKNVHYLAKFGVNTYPIYGNPETDQECTLLHCSVGCKIKLGK